MATIILHDASLKLGTSKADLVVSVAEGENMQQKIQQLASEIQMKINSKTPGCYNTLHIVCKATSSGLQLGNGIDATNVKATFVPLKYKIGNICIHGCDAAINYNDANKGTEMCRKLAKAAYVNVTASANSDFLFQNESATLKCTSWNGTVVTWNQLGRLVTLSEYNGAGVLTKAIDHPGQLLVHEFMRSCKKSNKTTSTFSSSIISFFRHYFFSATSASLKVNSL